MAVGMHAYVHACIPSGKKVTVWVHIEHIASSFVLDLEEWVVGLHVQRTRPVHVTYAVSLPCSRYRTDAPKKNMKGYEIDATHNHISPSWQRWIYIFSVCVCVCVCVCVSLACGRHLRYLLRLNHSPRSLLSSRR